MIRVNVQPQMLRWARERAGYSIETLGPRFPKLPNWEAGELQPTLKQLDRLRSFSRGGGGNFYLTQAARTSKRFTTALITGGDHRGGQSLVCNEYKT